MTNVERLDDAICLGGEPQLTDEERAAIDSLSPEDMELIIAAKNAVREKLNLEMLIAPCTHHHQ